MLFQSRKAVAAFFYTQQRTVLYEKSSLRDCSTPDHWLGIRHLCLECRKSDPSFNSTGDNFLIAWSNKKNLKIFLIYTVHSISKATVSTVAIFFTKLIVM